MKLKTRLSDYHWKELIYREYGLSEIDIGYKYGRKQVLNYYRIINNSTKEWVTEKGRRYFCCVMKDDKWNHLWYRIMEIDQKGKPHSILINMLDVKDFTKGLIDHKINIVDKWEMHDKGCWGFYWMPKKAEGIVIGGPKEWWLCSKCGIQTLKIPKDYDEWKEKNTKKDNDF